MDTPSSWGLDNSQHTGLFKKLAVVDQVMDKATDLPMQI
jgi:hypothetical protein